MLASRLRYQLTHCRQISQVHVHSHLIKIKTPQVAYARASVISDRFRTLHLPSALLIPSLCQLHHSKTFLVHNRNLWFPTYFLLSLVSTLLRLLFPPAIPLCPLVTSLLFRRQFAMVLVRMVSLLCLAPLHSDVCWPVYSLVHCHSFTKARRSNCHVWCLSWLGYQPRRPLKCVTDPAKIFLSQDWQQLTSFLGTSHAKCSPYHPQTNAQTERFNLNEKRCTVSTWRKAHRLPIVLLALRTSHREAFDASSALTLYGMNLRLPNQFFPTANEWQTDPQAALQCINNEWHLISKCPHVSQLTKKCMSVNVCSRVLM